MIVVTSRPSRAMGPQRLERVHRAAVGLEGDHLPVGAGDRGADGDGQALADRAAGEA